MQSDNTIQPGPVSIRNGILFLSGYNISVSVDVRHLHVRDGVGRNRREGKFAKATSRLKRLLIMGQTGFVTFPALRWLHNIGATFIQLDYDATLLTSSVQGLDIANLRRAQAFLTVSDERADLAKLLLAPKIEAQASLLTSFGLADSKALERPLIAMRNAKTLDLTLVAEALAATLYWNKWSNVVMEFARRDKVPEHWRTFGSRGSLLTPNGRNATCPINAILNYLYTLLEVEAHIALTARGIDCGIGVFHTDEANRQSLAADVMEPVRPHVDSFALNLLKTRTFAAKDFFEQQDGGCRIATPLCKELVDTMPTWAKLVEPYAEIIARRVTAFAKHRYSIPANAQNTSARQRPHGGRLKIRTQKIVTLKTPVSDPLMQINHNSCRNCGIILKQSSRKFCNKCLPQRREEHARVTSPTALPLGPAKLAELKAKGVDPRSSAEARERRMASAMAQRREIETWQDDGSLDGVDFKRDIWPKIQGFSVNKLARAMRCSGSYATKIRASELTPHKRHWKTLLDLIKE